MDQENIREEYNKRIAAGEFDMAGFAKIVCIDDDVPLHNYKGPMVPVANKAGGIMNYKDPDDRKYGEGVHRRLIDMDENGKFIVVKEEHGFRPDRGARVVQAARPAASDMAVTYKLAAMLSAMEDECKEAVYTRLERVAPHSEYEIRLPREIYEDNKDTYKGYKSVYGINGIIELRHKPTGIARKVSLKEFI